MERVHGPGIAVIFTVLVLWTTFGSVFALLFKRTGKWPFNAVPLNPAASPRT